MFHIDNEKEKQRAIMRKKRDVERRRGLPVIMACVNVYGVSYT
jgi:hypothetical protein